MGKGNSPDCTLYSKEKIFVIWKFTDCNVIKGENNRYINKLHPLRDTLLQPASPCTLQSHNCVVTPGVIVTSQSQQTSSFVRHNFANTAHCTLSHNCVLVTGVWLRQVNLISFQENQFPKGHWNCHLQLGGHFTVQCCVKFSEISLF